MLISSLWPGRPSEFSLNSDHKVSNYNWPPRAFHCFEINPHSSPFLSLVTTLEEEIKDLEEEIAEYDAGLEAAVTFEEKKMYADLIIAREKTLTILIQRQSRCE